MYTGIYNWNITDEEAADLYSNGTIKEDLNTNQYLVLRDYDGKAIDYYFNGVNGLERVNYPQLGNNFTGIAKPRNPEQYCAFDMLKRDIPIKLITGRFGSGKTYGCVTAALEQVQSNKFEKIVFVRNNVQVKDTDQIGSLPGLI